MDSVKPGRLGGACGGNPVACAAASGQWRPAELSLVGRARHIESPMLPRLRELQQRYPVIGDDPRQAPCWRSSWWSPARPPNAAVAAAVNAACCAEEC